MAARGSVPVHILGKEYRVRGEGDEDAVHRVAEFVDQTMSRIRDRTKTVDTQDVAVLAALNIANDLLALREGGATDSKGDLHVGRERVRSLIELIDSLESA